MKVFIMTDLEGVAGITTFTADTYPDARYYEQAKRRLTAELNAAIEALVAEDVEDILVLDGHGPGGVEFDQLHEAAKLLHGRPLAPWAVWHEATRDYDVCMMVGQHAMAGLTDGNLSHTFSSLQVDSYTLNGQPVGEIAIFALAQGLHGTPMIFLSGDHAACREAEALLPRVVTACIKQGLSRNCAISVSAKKAAQVIAAGVRQAIQAHRAEPVEPLVWEPPYVLEKRFFHTDSADACLASGAGWERVDSQTVRLKRDRLEDLLYR